MPQSSWDGERWGPHYILEDDQCGQFGVGPAGEDLERQVALHFHYHHPHIRYIIHGVDYRKIESPMRCDLCGRPAELPWWDHTAAPHLHTHEVIDDDGHWLVCDPCHELVLAGDARGLTLRAWKAAREYSPGLTRGPGGLEMRAGLFEKMRLVVERFDPGLREEL